MEHKEIVDRLSEYIDDELSAADKELVERHLAACPGCVETLSAMKEVTEMIAGTPRVNLPEDAADRLAAAIDERVKSDSAPAPKTPRKLRRQWATHPAFLSVAGAAAVLVIAVAVWKSPAQKSELRLMRSPAQLAPPVAKDHGGDGAARTQAEGTATKQTVDRRLNEAAAGTLLKKNFAPQSAPEDKSAESTKLLKDTFSADSESVPVDKAAAIAGDGHPVRLLYSTSGAWKQGVAWIVIVERTDKPGYFIGAVVDQKDGRILYRRTKQRP